MKVRYKQTKDGICLTNCPNGSVNEYTGDVRKVGSAGCVHCKGYVKQNSMYVDCKYNC